MRCLADLLCLLLSLSSTARRRCQQIYTIKLEKVICLGQGGRQAKTRRGRSAINKREFLRSSALAAAASAALPLGRARAGRPVAAGERRNLLILTVDDMDTSLMGYMGNRHGLTPNLDALARRSHVFARNRGAAPICMPSRQAFMSGLVPHRNSPGGFTPMYEGTPTICSILHAAGWYCAASHKTEHMQPETSFPWDDHTDANDRNILDHEVAFRRAAAAAKASSVPAVMAPRSPAISS